MSCNVDIFVILTKLSHCVVAKFAQPLRVSDQINLTLTVVKWFRLRCTVSTLHLIFLMYE